MFDACCEVLKASTMLERKQRPVGRRNKDAKTFARRCEDARLQFNDDLEISSPSFTVILRVRDKLLGAAGISYTSTVEEFPSQ